MNYKKFLEAASAVLLIIIAITLVLAPTAWAQSKYKTLYKFKGGADGVSVNPGLAFDQAGNLYGTTAFGGHFNDPNNRGNGIVFKLAPRNGGWRKTELHAFDWDGKDGILPTAGVILDPLGNVYGTTYYGGAYGDAFGGCGSVFKLAPNPDGSWTESLPTRPSPFLALFLNPPLQRFPRHAVNPSVNADFEDAINGRPRGSVPGIVLHMSDEQVSRVEGARSVHIIAPRGKELDSPAV